MIGRNELHDQYEDALFSLIVDEVAEQKGAELQAEADRLNEDPSTALEEELDAKYQKTIRKLLREKRRKVRRKTFLKVLKPTIIVVVIAAILFWAAYNNSSQFRANVLNFRLTLINIAADWSLIPEPSKKTESSFGPDVYRYGMPEIPTGYELKTEFSEEEADDRFYWYENQAGEVIQIEFLLGSPGTDMEIDTENAQAVTSETFNGYDGVLVEKGGAYHAAWVDTDRQVFITLVCSAVNKETVIEMTKAMKYNGFSSPLVFSYVVPQIPDGYKIDFIISNADHRFYSYVNETGSLLQINILQGDSGTNMSIDTENAQAVSEVTVNGYSGLCVEKDGYIQVAWVDTDRQIFLFVHGNGINKKTAMEMAKEMKYTLDAQTNTIVYNYSTPPVPDGYEIDFVLEDFIVRFFSYMDGNGNFVQFQFLKGSAGTNMSIDTEDARSVVDVTINGYDGMCVEKDGTFQIVWVDTDREVFMTVYTTALDKETAIEMASAMKYQALGY